MEVFRALVFHIIIRIQGTVQQTVYQVVTKIKVLKNTV